MSWTTLTKFFSTNNSTSLEQTVQNGMLPRHVAIILDGNRRWAQKNFSYKNIAYKIGADITQNLITWWVDFDIQILTLYVLSLENLQRKNDLNILFNLLDTKLQTLLDDPRIHDHKIRVRGIGRIIMLPKNIQMLFEKLDTATKNYNTRFLNIAVAYSGQDELVHAVKKISQQVKDRTLDIDDIDASIIEKNLYTSHLPQSYPDLILRTSGEQRLSGFLTWQSTYSELIFINKFWPDFTRNSFLQVLKTFQKRHRRIGL